MQKTSSTSAAVGSSFLESGREAGREAASAALRELPDGAADLCLVFATTGLDQDEVLAGVAEVVGDARVTGCSGEGVIAGTECHERDHAVAVMAVRSDAIAFETFLLRDYDSDPSARGRELAEAVEAASGEDPAFLLVMPDGLKGNCTDFLAALEERLEVPVMVAGGTSADAMVFERTYQYAGREAASDAVAAVLISGADVEVAVSHGCSPIGLERTVTDAEGGWVRAIDGVPAWTVFKEYLDGDPEDLNAEGIVHLCIGQPLDEKEAEGYAPFVIRTPLALDKESGALLFPGGSMRSGQQIRLTRRDPERIHESAQACARTIVDRKPGREPALVLQFDCAGRGKVLFGTRTAEETLHPLQKALGVGAPWIGLHTYGEIAPISGRSYYHNYTVVLCALYDRDGDL